MCWVRIQEEQPGSTLLCTQGYDRWAWTREGIVSLRPTRMTNAFLQTQKTRSGPETTWGPEQGCSSCQGRKWYPSGSCRQRTTVRFLEETCLPCASYEVPTTTWKGEKEGWPCEHSVVAAMAVRNDYTCKCMSCEDDFPWRHKAWAINACRSSRERVSTWKAQKRASVSLHLL